MRSKPNLNLFRVLSTASLLFITVLDLSAQLAISDIQSDKIETKQIRKYLFKQRSNDINLFQDFRASWKNETDSSQFQTYSRVYIVKERLEKVWETYVNTSPTVGWKSKKSSLGLVYNRNKDEVLYPEDSIPALTDGNLLFVNLRLLKGLYKMATAFEITKVSKDQNTIEFSYIETGISRGKQLIKLESTIEGYTKIVHTSVIQSDSKFRDKVVYPFFHNKIINEFHKNMKRIVFEPIEYAYVEF